MMCYQRNSRSRFLALVLVLLCAASINATAQDRMPPIPADKLTDAQKQAMKEFQAARGAALSGPFVPMLRSPEVMSRARAMGDYLRYKSVLPARLSEFVILMTARHWTQNYEWSTHSSIAVKAGLEAEIVKAIADGRRPERMAEDEAILYDFCDELHRKLSISDATYARAVSKFGEQGVIDTVGIVGYYSLLAMVLNTARTPSDPSPSALAPFPR
jgi:4-carboxymuconolactone decarboxylase